MLHDIFAACELYTRLYQRVRNANVSGVCYRTMSHAVETASGDVATPPEATVLRYLDLFWQIEACIAEVADCLGERAYLRWASARLLGCASAEEAWALWATLPPESRPTLGGKGPWCASWQGDVHTGDLILDRALQQLGLLRRPS